MHITTSRGHNVPARQVQMSATTPDGDVLGTLAVAMSKHGMMMPYLSLSKQTTSERSAVVLLCTHLKTSFAPKMSDTKLEMAPELIDHEMRARADMLALAAATKVIHVTPAALACAVVIMAVPGYNCTLRTLLLRVTLAGELACLKELIEIYLHMWKSSEGKWIYASIFLDCMPYAIVKRRHQHLAELLKAHLRAMQTRAEWMVRTNQPGYDFVDLKSGLDQRFALFGGKTLLMIACGAGDATCAEILLTGVMGRFMDPEGDNDGSFTMKSIMFRSGVDEAVREKTGSEGFTYEGWCTPPGVTALMIAVRKGSVDCGRLLLAHNADPNAENPANETALTLAARRNSPRDIEYLVQAGARVNQVDYGGKTPMHHLARWKEDDRPGTADAIRLLSQHGANPDAQDNDGCSPLIIAARESNCHEVVRALLEAAADRTLVDGEGKTAFMYARSETILRMLRGDIE